MGLPSERILWIVRHGLRLDFVDPDWAASAENPYDPPLHPEGVRQAAETAERLAGESIDHIFASPFLRTVQTAGIIATHRNDRLNLEPGFSEWLTQNEFSRRPVWSDPFDMSTRFPAVRSDYRVAVEPRFPEDRKALDTRIETALSAIMDRYAGNLLIVSHGSPIESIHRALTGTFPDAMPSMASITRYHMDSGVWKSTLNGAISHLSHPDLTSRAFYSELPPKP